MDINAREHDAKTADLYHRYALAARGVDAYFRNMRRAAGDRERQDGFGAPRTWGMSAEQVIAALEAKGADYAGMITEYHTQLAAVAAIRDQVAGMEAIYRTAPWQRYFVCLANGGHIHATERGCSTIGPETEMAWRYDISGATIAEAVADLGPALCTHCFPDAPVEMTRGELREVTEARAARDAAKAEREAAKAAKNLTPAEYFRNAYGDRVTTIAAAKEALRDERRFAHYRGIDQPHSNMYEDAKTAAADARRVLAARGLTTGELDTIVARADATVRREWRRAAAGN